MTFAFVRCPAGPASSGRTPLAYNSPSTYPKSFSATSPSNLSSILAPTLHFTLFCSLTAPSHELPSHPLMPASLPNSPQILLYLSWILTISDPPTCPPTRALVRKDYLFIYLSPSNPSFRHWAYQYRITALPTAVYAATCCLPSGFSA